MDYMHYLKIAVDILNWVALNIPWEAVAASGALSVALLGPYKLVKRWFDHNQQVMVVVVGIAGVLAVGIHHILGTASTDPTIVLLQGLALAWGTQPFYRILVKPASAYLGVRISRWWSTRVAQAVQLDDARSALEPAGGVVAPTAPTGAVAARAIPVIQDFKR